ncbi:hypothetical protein GCM10027605_67660 [Micromonospora zhanjiangensis]
MRCDQTSATAVVIAAPVTESCPTGTTPRRAAEAPCSDHVLTSFPATAWAALEPLCSHPKRADGRGSPDGGSRADRGR